jgi:hypothetical protein
MVLDTALGTWRIPTGAMDGAAGEATEGMPEWLGWHRGMSDGAGPAVSLGPESACTGTRWARPEWASTPVGGDGPRAEAAAVPLAAVANAAADERTELTNEVSERG